MTCCPCQIIETNKTRVTHRGDLDSRGCTLDVGKIFPCLRAGHPRLRADLPGLRAGLPSLRVVHPHMRADLPRLRAGLPCLRVVHPHMRAGLPRLRAGLPRARRTCSFSYSPTCQSCQLVLLVSPAYIFGLQAHHTGTHACVASHACPATRPSYPPMVLLSACPPHYLEPS
jgi:hypothetical protein